MTTLKESEKLIQTIFSKTYRPKKKIAEKWFGKFKGIIPEGKNSSEYIREMRNNLYGKIK